MKRVCPLGSVPWHQFEADYAPAHKHTHAHIRVYTWDTNQGFFHGEVGGSIRPPLEVFLKVNQLKYLKI